MNSINSYPLKRSLDVSFSIFAIILLSPIFLIVFLIIKIKSPDGPVIFGHERIGKNGESFKVYKFRSMVVNAQDLLNKLFKENPVLEEEFKRDFKLKDDPRIIPGIGNFIRKTSLDELPQFFNVLIGNMSVVGPRPIVKDEVEKYKEHIDIYYKVKPGLTGLWQVSGRNDIDYNERVCMDLEYIQKQSLWTDIIIILKTVKVMLFRSGAY